LLRGTRKRPAKKVRKESELSRRAAREGGGTIGEVCKKNRRDIGEEQGEKMGSAEKGKLAKKQKKKKKRGWRKENHWEQGHLGSRRAGRERKQRTLKGR